MGGECSGSRAGSGRGVGRGLHGGAARTEGWSGRRGGEGRGSGPRGRGWLGSGTQGTLPALPASARPCQALLCGPG